MSSISAASISAASMSAASIGTSSSLYDIFTTFLTVFGALTSGLVLGFTIVSYFVYDKDYKCEEVSSDEEDEESDKNKYCFKFFDELENLPECELDKEELEELRLKTIEEETPEGKVIMSYNSDTESFWYYANSTTIPYSSLDAVARLYTVTYNCKNICINYREEWEKGKERVIKEKEFDLKRREEEEHTPKPKSIFAQFKGYNKKSGSDDEKKKYYIMTERANKFKYKGKISEFIKKENASVSGYDASVSESNASVSGSVSGSTTASVSGSTTASVSGSAASVNDSIAIVSGAIVNGAIVNGTSVIEKKKLDYSTFKKLYIEKKY